MADPADRGTVDSPFGDPPGSWRRARRFARRALAPVQKFLSVEASSGILILAATACALFWANSPWKESYDALWHLKLALGFGPWSFERDLHFWINDGLMTIFFLVVGLEIRREMHRGALSDARRAAFPLAAALGGMVAPALIYALFNGDRASIAGWGVPIATDIAFAVGVLTLLGPRLPPALRILLLTLAVVDDVGAILVIALFYSSGFSGSGFLILAVGLAAILGMQSLGFRNAWSYVPAGAVVWIGAYAAGIHPTLAGVVLGLLTPVRAWVDRASLIEHAGASVAAIQAADAEETRDLLPHLETLDDARRESVSPVERLEHSLHGYVAFGVMPLFALANAGITLGSLDPAPDSLRVFLGVFAGLLLGKPLGILLVAWLAIRLGLARLPAGIRWSHVALLGIVAGIGFSMSIFIAELAFPAGALRETAKIGILAGSGLAAAAAFAFGWWLKPETSGEPADEVTR